MTDFEKRLQRAIELAESKLDALKLHPQSDITADSLEQQIVFGRAVLASGEPLEIEPQALTLEALCALVKS